MKTLAVILTGFDDSCCRSNGLGNFYIIEKAIKSSYSLIDIYIHPSERKFLYQLFIRRFKEEKNKTIAFKYGWKNKSYHMIYTLYSSVIESLSAHQQFCIFDQSLPDKFISKHTRIEK